MNILLLQHQILKLIKCHISLVLLLVLLTNNKALALPHQDDPDLMFMQARELASENNYEKALPILTQILDKYPDYHDASILKARIYAWQNQHDRAREILKSVLVLSPQNSDAINALIDVEMWSANYIEAIDYIDKALLNQPGNNDLLLRKATALNATGDEAAALQVLNQILETDPNHQEALALKDKINITQLKTSVGLGYRGHYFIESAGTDPWHLYFAELGRISQIFGRVTARVNIAQRHSMTGFQAEIDAYPILRSGTYLYLNFGYSPDIELFPVTRYGFEVFQALPAAMEISAGIRFLNFQYQNLLILTGSVSKSAGKYYFSFRPFFPFSSLEDAPSGQSFFLTVRRHFLSADDHLSLIVGRGFSLDMDRFIGGQIYDLGGTLADAMLLYQHGINRNFILRLGVGYSMYDDKRSPVPFGDPLVLTGGVTYRF